MFYGALVLSKKGPLAKVWLAAHWDKKLTKAHVFETDVESSVDSILSPQIKLALRTSGHLLLGVVRIYSRKQKYLLHDLGEACAKIKMAFRPGIVDLPTGAENADAITLPEIFHNFESAVSDLGALEIEAQHTVNPSRTSEITIAEDPTTTTGSGDIFGGEFGGYDLKDGEFGRDMEDIELLRPMAEVTRLGANKIDDSLKNGGGGSSIDISDDKLPDPEFGGGGFDGFGGEFGFEDMPSVSGLTAMESKLEEHRKDEDVAMEVDPQRSKTPEELPQENEVVDTLVNPIREEVDEEEEGFVLEPVDATGLREKQIKRKRRLVVDNDKEFTGQQIKSQFDDFKDLLQPKCFPPPTKKAMTWKEMAGCEQLYSNPTMPLMSSDLTTMVTQHYSVEIPGEPLPETVIELDNIASASRDINATMLEIETASASGRVASPVDVPLDAPVDAPIDAPVAANTTEDTIQDSKLELAAFEGVDLDLEGLGDETHNMENGVDGILGEDSTITDMAGFDEIPTQSTEEQQSNELSEEFEQRRWTKRTQQVLCVLQHSLLDVDDMLFSQLTVKCNRKQAASRFYTCLLLAKEGMITVDQLEPYADIQLKKGPKFAAEYVS